MKLVRSSRWISSFELGFGGEVEQVAGGEDVLMSLGKEWLMRSANNAGEAKAFPWLFGKSAYPEGGREAGCLPNGLAQDSPATVSPRDPPTPKATAGRRGLHGLLRDASSYAFAVIAWR